MKTLREYQVDALQCVNQTLNEACDRALVVMATGLGKTVVASAFVQEWLRTHSGRILFLAHSQDILVQARENQFAEACPELETGLVTGDMVENPTARMVFVTMQTMQRWQRRGKVTPTEFELVIMDEAHHGQATTYKKVITFFKPHFLMGLTATPDRADRQDIRAIFGNEVYEYPLARALADRWLADVDYRVMSDNVSLERINAVLELISDGNRRVSRRMIDSTIFLAERMEEVANAVRSVQGKRKIIFCRTIEHIRQMQVFLPDGAPYHSGIDQNAVAKRLKAFRAGELPMLLVVDKLNEGVDIPDADVLVFLRSTQSKTVWLQQLGRGLRKTEGKDRVTVLDFVANCDRLLNVAELGLDAGGHKEFSGLPSDPIRLEGFGWNISFEGKIRDVIQALEILESELYPTVAEAMAAVQQLDPVPKTTQEYEDTFRQDPRLPSNPWIFYKDRGWKSMAHYLGVDWYETFDEVRAGMLRLDPVPTSIEEYKEVYKQNPHLPSQPDRVYEGKGWIDWQDFFGTNPYDTIEEAMAAVQKLDPVPKTLPEYRKVYRQDKRLLSSADRFYEGNGWVSWKHYLGTNPYDTIEEAMAAVQKLDPVPKTREGYFAVRAQDLRLVSNADTFYRETWLSWPQFLGQPEKDLYERIEEAMNAVRLLGITSQAEYRFRYRDNPRLPSNPNIQYAQSGWVDWPSYLGTNPYDTIEEAMAAVQELSPKPTMRKEYLLVYKQNPRLPRTPELYYESKGWQGWPQFLNCPHSGKRGVAAYYYPAIEEAMAAVQRLNPVPTSNSAYKMLRRQDPGLPGDPVRHYSEAWQGWGHYLGTGRVWRRGE